MSLIADHMKGVEASPVFAIATKARELKKQGAKIFDLSIGEPSWGTPQNVKEAAWKAIQAEKTKYTAVDGIPELKLAVCEKYKTRIGHQLTNDHIVISNGAKQVLYNCFIASLNPKDEVILPSPYWVSYQQMIAICGGTTVLVPTSEASGFKANVKHIKNAITSKTKWLLINSPNNPTGAKYSRSELTQIANLMREYPSLNVISDDIYEELSYDGDVFSLIDIAPELTDRILVVNGFSKAYAMSGWRMGYGIGNKKLIQAMTIIQSQSTSSPCSVSQYAALEALIGDQSTIQNCVRFLKSHRDQAYQFFSNTPGFSCAPVNGAFYLFPNCSKFFGKRTPDGSVINSDVDFCNYLLSDAKVFLLPGSVFGSADHFRLSYAVADEELTGALVATAAATAKLV